MKRIKRKSRDSAAKTERLFAAPRVSNVRELSSPDLMVLTSNEELTRWSRRRVVEVLILEAEIEPAQAESIAERVEGQLKTVGLTAVSTSLIRELVGAELVVAGLAAHRQRHARIGVSIFDAGRILRGSLEGAAVDPAATARYLARRVKRDYALAAVFSEPVAEAHRVGDVHIHDLEAIDCPDSLWVGLNSIDRTGRPSDDSDVRLALAGRLLAMSRCHVARAVTLDAACLSLSPFLANERAARGAGRRLLQEMTAVKREPGPELEVTLHWDLPPALATAKLTGPGGRAAGVGADHQATARTVALALVEAARDAPEPFALPVLRVVIGADFFRTPGHLRFLSGALEAASRGASVRLMLARDGESGPPRPLKKSPRSGPRPVAGHRGCRGAILSSVSIDLPRIGYRAGGDREMVETRLKAVLEVAARAHIEKRVFLEQLLASGRSGPLGFLIDSEDGAPILSLEDSVHRIVPCGLNELTELVVGEGLRSGEIGIAYGIAFLDRMRRMVESLGRRHKLAIVLAAEPLTRPAVRFAKLDLRYHSPVAGHHVRGDIRRGEVSYTPGVMVDAESGGPLATRIEREGRLHDVVPTDASTLLPTDFAGRGVSALSQLVMEAFADTRCRELAILFPPGASQKSSGVR